MATHQPVFTLGAWNIESENPEVLGQFWADALGSVMHAYSGMAYVPAAGVGGVAVMCQPMTGARPERQLGHLDLTVAWGSREFEVQRLTALGAERQWDVLDEHPHVQWTTLADPEGNLFCIAEHPPEN